MPVRIVHPQSLPNPLQALLHLWRGFDDYHINLAPYYFKQPSELERIKRHNRYLEEKDSLYLVCLIDEKIVGFICGQWRTTPSVCLLKERNILELHGIYISPHYKNRGCARKLLEEVVLLAQNAHTDDIELFTWQFNEIIVKLLSNSGFKQISSKYGLRINE